MNSSPHTHTLPHSLSQGFYTCYSLSSHSDVSNNLCDFFLLCGISKKFLENSNEQVKGIQNSRMILQYAYIRLRLFINVLSNAVEIKIVFKIVTNYSYRKIRTNQGHKTSEKQFVIFAYSLKNLIVKT